MADPLEDVSLSSILRYGRDRLGRIAGEIPNEVAAGYRDLGELGSKVLGGITRRDNPFDEQLKRDMRARKLRGDDLASMSETPFGTHTTSDPAVKAGAMLVDPLNYVGAGVAATKGKALSDALLGRFKTTTPGRIVNRTKERGGYSVNLPTGAEPTEGLMMGRYRNDDPRNLVTDALTRAKVAEQAQMNKGVLGREDAYLGTWKDPAEGGKTYVDVSRRFPPEEVRQATKYGERTGQISGYDVGKKDTFPVGNWEEFVRSPEFHGRMEQMHEGGAEYLKQFPAKEWWDMHGGPFERVYGPENMKQVAGFTASTAPNAPPRENLQTMSEYMRRQIKGEPTVQPDWRVPEGEMTRQPGKQIGMEESRAANLRKSAVGDLEALQQDKVREEAAALMGDPNAVVLDRHHARLAEDPVRGIFTSAKEGMVEPGKQYATLKEQFTAAAAKRGMSARDYSARVWTGIREQIKKNSELYGQTFQGGRITGDSKSYADHFESLIADKAKHLGITVPEMESRLRSGDATLMAWIAATPLLAPVLADVLGEQPEGMQ